MEAPLAVFVISSHELRWPKFPRCSHGFGFLPEILNPELRKCCPPSRKSRFWTFCVFF